MNELDTNKLKKYDLDIAEVTNLALMRLGYLSVGVGGDLTANSTIAIDGVDYNVSLKIQHQKIKRDE